MAYLSTIFITFLYQGTLRIVDLPGHERLRVQFLDQFKYSTKAVGFVIDSVLVQKEIRDVAE